MIYSLITMSSLSETILSIGLFSLGCQHQTMIPIRAVALSILPTSISPEEGLTHGDVQYVFVECMNKGVGHAQFFFLINCNYK